MERYFRGRVCIDEPADVYGSGAVRLSMLNVIFGHPNLSNVVILKRCCFFSSL